jgi:D,D-heptose 1,7-bisphosphate phosphatase
MVNMKYDVVILAGGHGSRLKSVTGNIPKPLAKINDISILEYQLKACKMNGFDNIAILVHYEYQQIISFFGNGNNFGLNIHYVIEKTQRGTAGALFDSLDILNEKFLVLYGDTYFDLQLRNIYDFHIKSEFDLTLLLHPNDHPHDSDLVEIDCNNNVLKLYSYPHDSELFHRNLVNAGLYVVTKSSFKLDFLKIGKFDIAKHVFPFMLENNFKLYGYVSQEYIKDMGTPERILKVEKDINSGLTDKLSLRNFRSAIFLDRDGTLIEEKNRLNKINDLELIDGVAESIEKINRSGYLSVMITNQPVIARGDLTYSELEKIHNKLDFILGNYGAYLDAKYYCPHHPDSGFEGEIKELKIKCNCRKPNTQLIDQSVIDLQIDRNQSWFIGDTTTDILAGKRAGLKTILVRTGYAGYDGKYSIQPDYIMPNLPSAVDFILKGQCTISNQLIPILSELINTKLILIGGSSRSGKSTTAKVISDTLKMFGKKTHIISMDGWLLPTSMREEGIGVLKRYNMSELSILIDNIVDIKNRTVFQIPIYDRKNRNSNIIETVSIGSDDIIILEGVPALMDIQLCQKTQLRLFLEVEENIRESRIREEYKWRSTSNDDINSIIESRSKDESPDVLNSKVNATHIITNNL